MTVGEDVLTMHSTVDNKLDPYILYDAGYTHVCRVQSVQEEANYTHFICHN